MVATFNTLGAAHTSRRGKDPRMRSGPARTQGVVELLRRHRIDVVGFQELERPQARAFRTIAGSSYSLWHPVGDTENAIAWRRDRFRLVRARTQEVHYFNGNVRLMPVVLLRDRRTARAVWVVNVHNPADTRRFHHQERWRRIDMARERRVVRQLLRGGRPVLVTGDMNQHEEAFCAFTMGGHLHAAAGGSHPVGRCRPPGFHHIDWIFGSRHVRFSGFHVDRSPLVKRTTDHGVVLARARLLD